jgi:hypothetical protein
MQISEIKNILEECQRGDILLHSYLPTQYGRQFDLLEFPGKENIRYWIHRDMGEQRAMLKAKRQHF